MTKYFGAGAKVRQLESTSVAENVLTLRWTRMNLKFYSISLTWHNILRYFDAKLQKNK